MKKFLALALALAMIASMSAVSFAATLVEYGDVALPAEEHTIYEDDGDYFFPVVNLVGPFGFDAEDRALFDTDNTPADGQPAYTDDIVRGPVEFGDAAYYALLQFTPDDLTGLADGAPLEDTTEGYLELVTKSEVVANLKIKADWEEGGDMVKDIKIIKRKIVNPESDRDLLKTDTDYDEDLYYPSADDLGLTEYGYKEGGYYYFLVITYEDSTSHNDVDVIGTLTFNKSKDPSIDDMDLDVGLALDWEYNYRDKTTTDYIIDDDPSFEFLAEKNYALKFDSDEEVELTFEDDSTFTVDVSGQGKMLFSFNTNYISKVAAKYPYAELNFWNGNGAKFNRVGEFFLNCEDLEGNLFLYQVNANGTLSEVAGAEWDESDEGFYFNTRVLGSYVVSDMELDVVSNVQGAVTAPVAPAPVVTNPSTGVEG